MEIHTPLDLADQYCNTEGKAKNVGKLGCVLNVVTSPPHRVVETSDAVQQVELSLSLWKQGVCLNDPVLFCVMFYMNSSY